MEKITRRTIMKAAVFASPELAALLAAYAIAVDANTHAWREHSRIEDSPELESRPFPRVQVEKRYKGRDEDRNEVYDPIYAYCRDDIEKAMQRHLDADLAIYGNGQGAEERVARIRKNYADRTAELAAKLEGMAAQRKAMEDAAGLTAAMEAGRAAATRVREIEQQIIAYVPTTLADVVAIAAWTIKGVSDDAEGFLDNDAPLKVLTSFGKAVTK